MKKHEWVKMEEEGIAWLQSKGFKVLVRGGVLTPFDVIVAKNDKQYIVNIKATTRHAGVFGVHFRNLERLMKSYPQYIPCILFVCDNEYYLFQYVEP
ncbi:MAG: hypothetical protein JRD89_13195 [Deltaproteobacteria bacterium]|nr:hypothetical protein [Deltaproteobacteria bacterium]